jgi:hypothetical protein
MSRFETPVTYNEPTVMWRMRRGQAHWTHAVIGQHGSGARLVWFVNSRPIGVRDFDDWTTAIRWSDQMREHNWKVGWRLVPDSDNVPVDPETR